MSAIFRRIEFGQGACVLFGKPLDDVQERHDAVGYLASNASNVGLTCNTVSCASYQRATAAAWVNERIDVSLKSTGQRTRLNSINGREPQ
jgi:hypothetical protein